MKLIPIVLVNGALGSGKTTFVRQLLAGADWRGSMLIENEFASVNIDQQIVASDKHHDVVEISGSCICCSTGEELEAALGMLAQSGWDKPVIIEATGMANSAKLAERLYLNQTFLERFEIVQTVLLIDALEVDDVTTEASLSLEIQLSDTVIINKVDLAKPGHVASLAEQIARLNPNAKVVTTSKANFHLPAVAELSSRAEQVLTSIADQLAGIATDATTSYSVVRPNGAVDIKELCERLTADAKKLGIRRVKGFVSDSSGLTWLIEATDKHVSSTKQAHSTDAVLVVIGREAAGRDWLQELGL